MSEKRWVYRVVAYMEKMEATKVGEKDGSPVFRMDEIELSGLGRAPVEICFDGGERALGYLKTEGEAWEWLQEQAEAEHSERQGRGEC